MCMTVCVSPLIALIVVRVVVICVSVFNFCRVCSVVLPVKSVCSGLFIQVEGVLPCGRSLFVIKLSSNCCKLGRI